MVARGSARILVFGGLVVSASTASAFGIFGNTGLSGGFRWDAAPRVFGGQERSLNGGLRYSMQGGSYQALRDSLSWSGPAPTVGQFQTAVQTAFAAWTQVDPLTNLGSTLSFSFDQATSVSTSVVGGVRLGAEIDIFAATSANSWTFGDSGLRAEAFFNAVSASGGMTLTSGTTGYGGAAISGADITFNNNTGALYTLPIFQTILTHEIGHALGLADVDVNSGPNGTFIDDNYIGANSATALATLTNSFALLVNPLNPSLSPFSMFTVANGDPGFDTPGVDILMETNIPGSLFGLANPLRNDDYAGRQFLYPTFPVPEPGTIAALALGIGVLARRRRRKA